MSAGEGLGHARVVLLEGRSRLWTHERVGVAEKSVAKDAVVVSHSIELTRLELLEMGNRILGNTVPLAPDDAKP